MTRDPRYDILFEPVRIGPVTAPNRFYQTPHAIGMNMTNPRASAALRGVKAEGGWGVVCTEYCSIHPSSDDGPYGYLTLWDDEDARSLALIADAVHQHGSLAAIELWHGGSHASNRSTRDPLLAPSDSSAAYIQPAHARAMDLSDIRALLDWQRDAAIRARTAGFDIVYVYAGHDYLPFQFLSPITNHRTDAYGGSLENRARLLREMIEVTKDAVGDTSAVAVRLGVDELRGPKGITSDEEGRAVIEMLAELPDLWDVNLSGGLGNDSQSARISDEGYQESYVAFVKQVTSKPVVSVGRFTSPDRMASLIKRGVQDFIGAARPSIADPFLPKKIAEGRIEEIRECIGCNFCRAANNEGAPIRCTQNPTIGEEWRRGWHPERIEAQRSDSSVLVVGAGPAGLEAAVALGRRGYPVYLADAGDSVGGRLNFETTLPGLSTWGRVRDHRQALLNGLVNVQVFLGSTMSADDVFDVGVDHVVIATGSRWRRDGVGNTVLAPLDLPRADARVLTPDDVFAGAAIEGPVVIYDDDHYAIGGALAEQFANAGHDVTMVTPAPVLSSWTAMTDDQAVLQARLMRAGIVPVLSHKITGAASGILETACVYTDTPRHTPFGTLILVTGRRPERALFDALYEREGEWSGRGIATVTRVGDCLVPSSVADAVFRGHAYARGLDAPPTNNPLPRERPLIEAA